MAVRGHAIPLAALVTAVSLVCGLFPLLTARNQRRVDEEPDVSDRRVWRRWRFRPLFRISPGSF